MTLTKFHESDHALRAAKRRWADLADIFYDYDRRIREYVEALSPGDRQRLVRDAAMYSSTNCGWGEYAAMHEAAAEARWRLRVDSEASATAVAASSASTSTSSTSGDRP